MSSPSPSIAIRPIPRLFNHYAYWCHACDSSIDLPPSPTPNALLCPHCHHDSLEQMDSLAPTHPNLTAPNVNFLLTTAPPANSHSKPAPKCAIDSLQEIIITQELLDEDDLNMLCPICKDPFHINASVKLMPCNHTYHADCIVPWLEINNSCPVCRFRLPTDEKKYGEPEESDGGERYLGGDWLEVLVDDDVDFLGFRNTHIARRHQRDEEGIVEENIASGSEENLFSPTQTGEVGIEEGFLVWENSVETLPSWPWELLDEGSDGGRRNDDLLL